MASITLVFSRSRASRTPRRVAAARLAAWLLLALCVVAWPVRATGDVMLDSDDDGVADAVDRCPDTEPSDLVGADGCLVCSCVDGPSGTGWTSHREYVACVRRFVHDGRVAGTVTVELARLLARRARASTCGLPETIRCCVFQPFDAEEGRCRLMSEAACDALDDRLFHTFGEADVEDEGSCLPNPCTF